MIKNDLLESDEVNSDNNQDYFINNIVRNEVFPIENLLKIKNFFENNKEKTEKIEIEYNSEKEKNIEYKSNNNGNNFTSSNEIKINVLTHTTNICNDNVSKIDNKDKNNKREKEKKNKGNKQKESKQIIKFFGYKIRNKLYRKDYYYKHFKSLFGKYLKNKVNNLKNKCFPDFIFNNFSTPNYSFIGNAKELDNLMFLSWTIKDILVYKQNIKKANRQYNNKLLIEFIENNEKKSKDNNAYEQLINYLNDTFENAIIGFYEDESELNKINQDEDCLFYDIFFKKETGISLLENNGFLKIIKQNQNH